MRARKGEGEYLNFLNIAFGSLREVGYYLSLAPQLGFMTEEARKPIHSKYDETATVLASLINSLG
ncbi:MAG: four helix bundle protein [Phycisphaerae bacterium]